MVFLLVGIDGHKRHAAYRIGIVELLHALLTADYIRAVIATESNDEYSCVFETVERIVLSIDSR
jgi:hypothetical protein